MGAGQSFLENLEWRRAAKHFSGGAVDSEGINRAIINAPSSFGIQPYKVYAVKNKETKEALRKVSYDQAQVTECDTLYIFCARTDVEERAEEYLVAAKGEYMRGMLMGFVKGLKDKQAWSAKQAYIALGFALAAAAELQIESCPMEGFNPVEVVKILSLPKNLVPCVFLAVGEKAEDKEPGPRFRFPASNLIVLVD
uniref:Nitroreductase domain-containing protein n=1 Tax=viral metagenome TaxID=1070528 RepID=A0A6C0KX77_9ZZZZ